MNTQYQEVANFHIEEKAGTALPNLLKEIKDISR